MGWLNKKFQQLFDFVHNNLLVALVVLLLTIIELAGYDPITWAFGVSPLYANIALAVLVVLIGYMMLKVGADKSVAQSVAVVKKFKLGAGAVALIIAFGTAITEFAFVLVVLGKGQSEVVFSAITASDQFNAACVFGLAVILTASTRFLARNMSVAVLSLVAMTVLIAIIGWHGFNSILSLGAVVFACIAALFFLRTAPQDAFASEEEEQFGFVQLITGLAFLLIGTALFFDGTLEIVKLVGTPKVVVGIVAAFAASAPELQILLPRVRRGEIGLETVMATALASNALDSLVMSLPGV